MRVILIAVAVVLLPGGFVLLVMYPPAGRLIRAALRRMRNT